MQRTFVIILVVLVGVVLGGAIMYSLSQSQNGSALQNQSQSSNVTNTPSTMNENEKTSSRYLIYSPQTLQGTKDKKRILFFYASWCPTCIPADADFSKNADSIPEEAVLIRVNYNDPETDEEEKALAQKYGVTYQHTFVQIDMQGNQITKWNGGQTDELLANIQ